ncbi:cation transport protein-domain-containing protein [Lentinula novae-zelandiae]|nr:cation transport protein-domain-containing protein [Lentinula novae-zelandiae]
MLSREASAKPPSGNFLSRLYDRIENFVLYQSTFFRLHLFAFVFIPLISSAIFWGCNGRFKISYLDSLFLCYSAMTVTGLSTVNLSSMTVWQQIILYLLMMMVRTLLLTRTCEYEYVAKKRSPPQDRKTFLASISPPMNAKRAREPVPINNSNNRPRSPKSTEGPTPTFKLIHPTPAATFDIVEKVGADDRVHEQTNLDDPSLFTDNNALTSSPEAINTELPPEPVTSLSPRAHGVDFAYTTSLRRVNTFRTTNDANASDSKHKYDMGFPGPVHIARKALKTFSPKTYRKLERKLTMPYTRTVEGNNVSWLSPNSEIVVGPNSDFHVETLSDDLVEQIGGIEYVALRWLSYMVPLYFIGTQLISFILFVPWLSATHQYDDVFANQLRIVQKPWFSLFQVMGAYTGGGLSLVDEGMVPFQSAYLMVFSLMFVILAGNHALVGFQPFMTYKFWSDTFIYSLYCESSELNWHDYNIGLEVWTSLSIGPRIVSGLFQGLAARASGFSIVSVSSLAPATQFLYVVMMYIAIYPVCFFVSLKSICRYEERSLGVFEAQPEEVEEEPTDFGNLGPRQRVGRYIGWHLRRQLSIDIWWLVWGVFLIAIIERDNLLNDDLKWFDLFRVLFELVSAFGGIGLSLGIPTENYSFVGAMRPLSKLVVIVIMVRGRHRGLPVAVDRAVMLPEELMKKNKDVDTNADVPRAPMSPLSTSNGNGHLDPLAEEV